MITNKYIDSILFRLVDGFGGTFSSDDCCNLSDQVSSVILNFSKRGTRGSHFVAFIRRKNIVLYIDSLNTPLDLIPDDITKWMKRQRTQRFVNYFKYTVQDVSSTFCGFYCMLALLQETYGVKPVKFNRKKLIVNDNKCINQILKTVSKIKVLR